SSPSRVRRPRPPTTSPTNRIVQDFSLIALEGYWPRRHNSHLMAPVVVRRWVQLVLLPLALLALWALARAAGTLFLVLLIACLVALVLAPPVRLVSRLLPTGLAIPVVY